MCALLKKQHRKKQYNLNLKATKYEERILNLVTKEYLTCDPTKSAHFKIFHFSDKRLIIIILDH